MAIGYSGPRAQSYTLLLNDNGAQKSIYLQTKMVNLQPTLKNTNILNLIKNNAGVGMHDANSNTRFYFNIKEEGELTEVRDHEGLKVDPREIKANKWQVIAKQIAPIDRVIKFEGFKKDLALAGLENLVSIKIADYISQKRLKDQSAIFKKALMEVSEYQKANLNGLTTFDEGAHFVTNKIFTGNNGNEAHNHLCEAIDNFTRLGQENANHEINQKIPHCYGIPLSDMIILASNQFTTVLKKVPGIFAGPSGDEFFKKHGIDMVEGVPYYATNQLPKGVNFIILTTGLHGAIAYEECGNIISKMIDGREESVMNFNFKMVDDPNYSEAYRIDFTDTIKMDIIFPELIFISSSERDLPNRARAIKTAFKDEEISSNEAKMILDGYKIKLNSTNENIEAIKNNIQNLEEKIKNNGKDQSLKDNLAKQKNILKDLNNSKEKIEKSIKDWKSKINKYLE